MNMPSRRTPLLWPAAAALLVALAILSAALLAQRYLWQRSVKLMAAVQLDDINQQAFMISARLGGRVNDLFFLKHVAEDGGSPGLADESNLRNVAAGMMLSRPGFCRVGLLGPEGRDIFLLRAKEITAEGYPKIEQVPAQALEDRSGQPWYLETIQAPLDAVQMSEVKFSDQLEKPIIRFSAKIGEADGSPAKILFIDYSADELVREIRLNPEADSARRPLVLTAEGTWLIGPNAAWILGPPEPGADNLKTQNPGLWDSIMSQPSGSFHDKGFLYCFRNIEPIAKTLNYPAVRLPVQGSERFRWTLLSKVPDSEIREEAGLAPFMIWVISGLAACVLVPFSWAGAVAIQRRKAAIQQSVMASQAEQEMRKKLEFALAGAHCGMWENNIESGLITVDATWSKMFGFESSMTMPFSDFLARFVHPDDLPAVQPHVEKFLAGGVPMFEAEHRNMTKSGEWRWIFVRGSPISLDEQGRPLRIVGIVIDITNQRLASQQLRNTTHALEASLSEAKQLAEQAQAAERAKDDFLAMMSHEIRTPINGVLGFAELLSRTPLQPDQKDFLQTLTSSGEVLLRIIDDILDFIAIQSGELKIGKALFSPREVVTKVVGLLSSRASRKGILIRTDIADDLPEFVLGDSKRLRQILMNLADNAIKFSHCGHITLGVRQVSHGKPDQKIPLEFRVEDMGVGIPEEKMDQIFDPFAQADASRARQHGGTGLGLCISRKLAEAMGGSLEVESTLGKGSVFLIEIPFDSPAAQDLEEVKCPDLGPDFSRKYPLRILVAEDDPTNLKLTSMILKNLGYDAYVAANGGQAVDLFASQRPDLILMDMQMPAMSGLQATQEIRKIEQESGTARPVYITALTANTISSEREECFAAGMNDHVSKPINRTALAEALIRASEFRHCAVEHSNGEHGNGHSEAGRIER